MATATNNQVPAALPDIGTGRGLPGLGALGNMARMPMFRQIVLMVGLAASVAIGFAVVLWSQEPDYQPLFNASLPAASTSQAVETLGAAGIPFKVSPNNGALLVRSKDLSSARMQLAAAGLVPNDGTVGFELLDKDQGLGSSQFIESTRYRRGLEGELARTVSSLNNVKGARVHLAIPKSSVFVRDERKPSASVLVELYPGRSLEPGQVTAIINLVATSVPELEKSQVTVVDQQGHLLSDQKELSEFSETSRQFDYTRRMESLLTQRVHGILQPVLGSGRYKAEVSADVDFNTVEATSEQYDPEKVLRSEQESEESRNSLEKTIGGIPGALSNQPPGAATAPEVAANNVQGQQGGAGNNAQQGAGQGAQPGQPVFVPGKQLLDSTGQPVLDPGTGQPIIVPFQADRRTQATRNYEIDRAIRYTRQQKGTLRRLSVAVVLDDQTVTDAEGKVEHKPWSQEQLDRFAKLVRDAVGYDEKRGDSVSVINAPFAPVVEDPSYEPAFYTQSWFWDIVKQVLGVVFILLLVFGVLRPLMKGFISGDQKSAAALAAVGAAGVDGLPNLGNDLAEDKVSLQGPKSIMLPSPSEGYEAQLNAIKSLVAEDPGRVAQVVKDWVKSDE